MNQWEEIKVGGALRAAGVELSLGIYGHGFQSFLRHPHMQMPKSLIEKVVTIANNLGIV